MASYGDKLNDSDAWVDRVGGTGKTGRESDQLHREPPSILTQLHLVLLHVHLSIKALLLARKMMIDFSIALLPSA